MEEAARSVEEALGELSALNVVYTRKENCYSESVITMMFYDGVLLKLIFYELILELKATPGHGPKKPF